MGRRISSSGEIVSESTPKQRREDIQGTRLTLVVLLESRLGKPGKLTKMVDHKGARLGYRMKIILYLEKKNLSAHKKGLYESIVIKMLIVI